MPGTLFFFNAGDADVRCPSGMPFVAWGKREGLPAHVRRCLGAFDECVKRRAIRQVDKGVILLPFRLLVALHQASARPLARLMRHPRPR